MPAAKDQEIHLEAFKFAASTFHGGWGERGGRGEYFTVTVQTPIAKIIVLRGNLYDYTNISV